MDQLRGGRVWVLCVIAPRLLASGMGPNLYVVGVYSSPRRLADELNRLPANRRYLMIEAEIGRFMGEFDSAGRVVNGMDRYVYVEKPKMPEPESRVLPESDEGFLWIAFGETTEPVFPNAFILGVYCTMDEVHRMLAGLPREGSYSIFRVPVDSFFGYFNAQGKLLDGMGRLRHHHYTPEHPLG